MEESGAQRIAGAARNFADKAAAGFRTLKDDVAEASKDFLSSGKLKQAQADKQDEINDAFRQLGELAYQSNDLTGKMKTIADNIHKMYQELQDIEMARNDT